MRTLRIIAVIIFVSCLVFSFWANNRYSSTLNTDYPAITNSEDTLQISVNDPPEAIFKGLSAKDYGRIHIPLSGTRHGKCEICGV